MNTTSEMQLVQIDKLIPYINNARTHSPEQLNKLRSSLREFGFINPVIIDRDFNVIAGHGRILAAKARKYLRSALRVRGLSYARSEESVHNRRQPNGS